MRMDAISPAKAQRMKTPWPAILWVRKLHLYSGVLFAPAILFFAVTGLIQVFNLHKPQPSTGYRPAALILRLGALHKDQTFALPHQADGARTKKHEDRAAPSPPAPRPMGIAQLLLKGFAAAVAAGLIATTLLGLWMAYRFNRVPWLVGGLLLAGIVAPLVLIAASGN
jgi:hypothetical protein